MFFIFGIVYLFSVIRGEVWFMVLIMGVILYIGALFILLEFCRHLFVGGLLVGFVMVIRTFFVFFCVLLVLHVLWTEEGW